MLNFILGLLIGAGIAVAIDGFIFKKSVDKDDNDSANYWKRGERPYGDPW